MNNDMDDLVRQAAENYPLQISGADWDKIVQNLENSTSVSSVQKVRIPSGYIWSAAAFLLILCTTYIRKAENNIPAVADDGVSMDKPKSNLDKSAGLPAWELKNDRSVISYNDLKSNTKINLVHDKKPDKTFIHPVKVKGPFLIQSKEKTPCNEVIIENSERHRQTFIDVDNMQSVIPDITNTQKEQTYQAENTIINNETINSKKRFANKLYAGIVAGPDVSTVKSQKSGNAGYSAGFILGYQLNRRLSVETGVLWDRKDYYSVGKYFNKGGLGLPEHARVIDVDGYCNMFEIPVNIKYNWIQKKKHNFFATTGVSSYLMKKEQYDYLYEYYGNQYKYYKDYNNASKNWVSIINISIGYEKPIGASGLLRIEPYIKLPLNGVGIGKMPIASKGVLIGYVRSFH